jgi:uncharacterized caspase-like protein
MRALRRLSLAAAVALAPMGAYAGTDAGKIYGLVIGIDDYRYYSNLQGAVNDAMDIASALGTMGAEVVTLLDGAATREAILREWRRLAVGLGPEDRLVVTYAGHGTNEPERVSGNEADGLDETLILSGFAPHGPAAGERIIDDEIAELIALAGPGRTIFVADACHSGTLSRNIAPALGYRYVSVGRIEADPLPPPPPRPDAREGREETALFLGAADDSEKTPEFLIEGQARGALSFAFAAALRGAADANGDGIITKGEVETYVRRTVRSISLGSQRPQVAPPGVADRVLFSVSPPAPQTPPDATDRIMDLPFDELPTVSMSHGGGAEAARIFAGLRGVEIVPPSAPADLRVDLVTGTILSMVGDRVGDFVPGSDMSTSRAVQAAADKLRLATALGRLRSDLDVAFGGGDRTYRDGEVVTVEIAFRRGTGLTLVNVASDGRIKLLYPRADHDDPVSLPAQNLLRLDLKVQEPFGADHVIAIDTDARSSRLLEVLTALDEGTDTAALWNGLRALAHTTGDAPRVAVFPFHSLPGLPR